MSAETPTAAGEELLLAPVLFYIYCATIWSADFCSGLEVLAFGDSAVTPVAEGERDSVRLRLLEVDLVSSTISRPDVGALLSVLVVLPDSPTTKGDEACFELILSFLEDWPDSPTARGDEACLELLLFFLAELSSSTTMSMGDLVLLLFSLRSLRSLLSAFPSSPAEADSRLELFLADLSFALFSFLSSLPLSWAEVEGRLEDLRVDLS